MNDRLILQDGTSIEGELLGDKRISSGEVVFNTGMTGYEQSLTDPSYRGQILVFTYPLIGNYGVPAEKLDQNNLAELFESEEVHVRGVIVCNASEAFSHHNALESISAWLKKHNVPLLTGVDTRALTQKLREHGVMLGQIVPQNEEPLSEIEDPNELNLVDEVSCKEITVLEPKDYKGITLAVIDTGIKNNILRSFLNRGVRLIRCPWNTDISTLDHDFDGLFLANGPGNPESVAPMIGKNIEYARKQNKPVFGICLGNQVLALSVGAKTFKMKYGHRGVNQPCQDIFTKKAIITSQNHGFAVDADSLPNDFDVWFTNLNDGTVEGIKHKSEPVFSVQFHPEATPGPRDADYLFDLFLETIKKQ
jgi:carbamoyl-phosphate synthase small subunit